jgi:opacity protein-like surface antigen
MERRQTRSGRFEGRRLATWAMSLALLPVVAAAQEPAKQPKGRGFVFGGAIGGGSHSFPGGEGRVIAIGPVDGVEQMPYMGEVSVRSAKVVPASAVTPDTEYTMPLPASEATGGFSMHGGFAFNKRVALMAKVGISAGYDDGSINNLVGGVVARFWPTSRLWLEAGPAFGEISVSPGDGTLIRSGSIKGTGYQARAGVSVVRKPRWTLDLEAGYSGVDYDGFKANTVSFAVGASRMPR